MRYLTSVFIFLLPLFLMIASGVIMLLVAFLWTSIFPDTGRVTVDVIIVIMLASLLIDSILPIYWNIQRWRDGR